MDNGDTMQLPPSYDAAVLGQPYVIAPINPHPFLYPDVATLHHYVQQNTAPSAPPLSPPVGVSALDQVGFWRHHGLDLLASVYQVFITPRRRDTYRITDSTKTLMYTASIAMETTCCCCSSPRGPGITIHMASRSDHPVLIIHRTIHEFWCASSETDIEVTIPPDISLGTVEGKGSKFTLNNSSGDVVCYLKHDDSCCTCDHTPHEVVPAAFPHDVGLVDKSEGGMIVTFPTILDPGTRTLLLAFAINLVMSVIVVASTSVLYGLMTGWSAVLPREQNNPKLPFNLTDDDVAYLVSMTSMIGLAPSLASGPMVEYMGPRCLLLVSLIPVLAFWPMMAFATQKWLLYFGRAGIAICTAIQEAVVFPLVADLSSATIRGKAAAGVSVATAYGIFFMYVMAYCTSYVVATAFRVLVILLIIILMLFVPESPYWLVRRGKQEAARTSLRRLLTLESAVDAELNAISKCVVSSQPSIKQQILEMRKKQNILPLLLVLTLFSLRELGGRNSIPQYSVYIFLEISHEGYFQLDPFVSTVVLGLTRLIFSIVSIFIMDRFRRRPILLIGAGVCGVAQCLAGLLLQLEVPNISWLPLVALIVYIMAYSVALGPVMWGYLGELLPLSVRSLAVAIISVAYNLAIFIQNIFFLKIMSFLGVGTMYLLQGLANLIIIPLVIFCIPESANVSLHALHNIRRNSLDTGGIEENTCVSRHALQNICKHSKFKNITNETVKGDIEVVPIVKDYGAMKKQNEYDNTAFSK